MNLTEYSRRVSHEVCVGNVKIGSNYPIAVQSMTNTATADVEASVAQIERIADAGAPIVRLTAQGRKEGENLENIVREVRAEGYDTAIVADIHFDYKIALECAAAGVDKIRINPGNIGGENNVKEVAFALKSAGIPVRVGSNTGSIEKEFLQKYGKGEDLK